MYLSILLPSLMALYALYKNKLTMPGIILAWACGFFICYFGGLLTFTALAVTIILIMITDKMKKTSEDKTRTIYQIIGNLLIPTICIILYTLTNNHIFYVMYYAVLGASLADSLASGIGSFSKGKVVNILTMKKVSRGESGGVSLLGNLAALGGGILIASIYLVKIINYKNFILIAFMGIFGSTVDSVLGILFQGKYQCKICKKTIEVTEHCGQKTKLIKGFAFFDNNTVNLLSNVIIFILSYLILI